MGWDLKKMGWDLKKVFHVVAFLCICFFFTGIYAEFKTKTKHHITESIICAFITMVYGVAYVYSPKKIQKISFMITKILYLDTIIWFRCLKCTLFLALYALGIEKYPYLFCVCSCSFSGFALCTLKFEGLKSAGALSLCNDFIVALCAPMADNIIRSALYWIFRLPMFEAYKNRYKYALVFMVAFIFAVFTHASPELMEEESTELMEEEESTDDMPALEDESTTEGIDNSKTTEESLETQKYSLEVEIQELQGTRNNIKEGIQILTEKICSLQRDKYVLEYEQRKAASYLLEHEQRKAPEDQKKEEPPKEKKEEPKEGGEDQSPEEKMTVQSKISLFTTLAAGGPSLANTTAASSSGMEGKEGELKEGEDQSLEEKKEEPKEGGEDQSPEEKMTVQTKISVFTTLAAGSKAEEGDPLAQRATVRILCKTCGGDHWTYKCPQKDLAAASGSTKEAYVPPSMRAGAGAERAELSTVGKAEETRVEGDSLAQRAAVLMVCKTCDTKGDQLTSNCPHKDLAPQSESFVDKPAATSEAPAAAASGSTNETYVPPSMRAGAGEERTELSTVGKAEETKVEGDLLAQRAAVLMVCKTCDTKGDQLTSNCPHKDLAPQSESFVDKPAATSEAPASASGSTNEAHVPPGMRAGAGVERTGQEILRGNEKNSVRVTNLSEDTREPDLLALFQIFGTVSGVDLPIDQETGGSIGFAVVHFVIKEDGERAIMKLNGYDYNDLILRVEWDDTPREN